MPVQDSGSLDQNILLIRTCFCSCVGHPFDDVFRLSLEALADTYSPLSLPPPSVFFRAVPPKASFFYLASNGVWKSAAATYLHVCQALGELFVRSVRGEREVRAICSWSAPSH